MLTLREEAIALLDKHRDHFYTVREAAIALLFRIDNTDGMTHALYRSHLGDDADRLRAALESAAQEPLSQAVASQADSAADTGLTVAELNAIVRVLRSKGWHASAYDLKAIDEAVMAVRALKEE